MMHDDPHAVDGTVPSTDPRQAISRLRRDLRVGEDGLSTREAERRLTVAGPNVLQRRGGRRWPRQIAGQLVHPLAMLLYFAAVLAFVSGTPVLGVAIIVVVALNALFAFARERQAERAVEALRRYLPPQSTVRRDGVRQLIDATSLVPGDVLLLTEGDGVSADARLVRGAADVDMSTLTGESQPVYRSVGGVRRRHRSSSHAKSAPCWPPAPSLRRCAPSGGGAIPSCCGESPPNWSSWRFALIVAVDLLCGATPV